MPVFKDVCNLSLSQQNIPALRKKATIATIIKEAVGPILQN
jgi:hypothetical protein